MVKNQSINKLNSPCSDLASIWALRMLLNLNGWIVKNNEYFDLTTDTALLRTVGLNQILNKNDMKTNYIVDQYKNRQKILEEQNIDVHEIVMNNFALLDNVIKLNKTEQILLVFTAMLKSDEGLDNASETLGKMNKNATTIALSRILKIPKARITKALSNDGILAKTGLLKFSKSNSSLLEFRLELLVGFTNVLFEPQSDAASIFNSYFHKSSNSQLSMADFKHLDSSCQPLMKYLENVQKKKTRGVNILIYGRPGTGKTELVRALTDEMGFHNFEINMSDEEGDPLSGSDRLSAFRLAQQVVTKQKRTVLLFDEIEDIFTSSLSTMFSGRSVNRHKAWLNRMLEENPVPTFWLSNSISDIDNAFIRRFDIVLEMDHPPQKVRERIISKYVSHLPVTQEWIKTISNNADIAPGLIANAVKVVDLSSEKKSDVIEKRLEKLLTEKLRAMGYSSKLIKRNHSSMSYRLDAINSDLDVEQLITGLSQQPMGRLCIYGPPGTGKTEFGHYIAESLGKPLVKKRASDLLDKYVGDTEKNLADMFAEGRSNDAVLLLDEADSFLKDRMGARNSWEITQVNELLTQMEDYDGLFICSTNLVHNLDKASLRRFDFKIKFDYLQENQAWILFQQTLKDHGIRLAKQNYWKDQVSRYNNLTPGDFATVTRKSKLFGQGLSAESLFDGLVSEVGFKGENSSKGIGFTAKI